MTTESRLLAELAAEIRRRAAFIDDYAKDQTQRAQRDHELAVVLRDVAGVVEGGRFDAEKIHAVLAAARPPQLLMTLEKREPEIDVLRREFGIL